MCFQPNQAASRRVSIARAERHVVAQFQQLSAEGLGHHAGAEDTDSHRLLLHAIALIRESWYDTDRYLLRRLYDTNLYRVKGQTR
jgi:hypothetical protein